MKHIKVLFVLVGVVALLVACAPAAEPEATVEEPAAEEAEVVEEEPETEEAEEPETEEAEEPETEEAEEPETEEVEEEADSGFPVTIENCGNTLTFDQPPERVVSLYPPNTEMLILLGVQDRIIGVAGYGSATYLLPEVEAGYEALADMVLAEDASVPREVLIAAQPDLVTDNQPDHFYNAERGFATVEEITEAGAQIYTLTAKCSGGVVDATMEDIYTDFRNYGRIFGVEERAEEIIADMEATIADVQARIEGQPPVKVLVYDSGEGPLGIFGPGTYDYVFDLSGAVNVFEDLGDSYGQVSIEEVATREIDVFVVPDYGPDYTYAPSAEERGEWLIETFPETEAAKNRRVVILPYQNFNPSAQNAEGVLALASGFYPEAFE